MNTKRNIYLVGPMGAGKTTVGRRLADACRLEFVDSDQIVEDRTGRIISATHVAFGSTRVMATCAAITGARLPNHSAEDSFDLLPVLPFYRLFWEDGDVFDYSNDLESVLAQIRKRSPADAEGYLRFVKYSEEVFNAGYTDRRTPPEKQQFRYTVVRGTATAEQLEKNGHWSAPTKETQVDFTTNAPGRYTFAVQYIDQDLRYSKPAVWRVPVRSMCAPATSR